MRQVRAYFSMLTVVECATPVISFFIPQGDHVETYALQGRPIDSGLEPYVTKSARPVSFLTGDSAFLIRLMHVGALLGSDGATPSDNGALLASMAPLKTGDGSPAGRWWRRCGR